MLMTAETDRSAMPCPPNEPTSCLRSLPSAATETSSAPETDLHRQLFEGSAAIQLLVDPSTGSILDANPAACRFYGYARTFFMTLRVFDLNTLPEPAVRERMRAARKFNQTRFLFQHRRSDGSVADVEVHSSPIQTGNKKILHSIIHDISDRIRAERAQEESEARFRLLAEHAGDIITLERADGTILYCSPAVERILGISAGNLIGQCLASLSPSPTGQLTQAEKAPADPWVLSVRGQDGNLRWLEATRHKIGQQRNTDTSCVTVYRDITERKEAADRLHAANQRFTRIVDALDACVSVTDPETAEILFQNQALRTVTEQDAGSDLQAFMSRATPLSETADPAMMTFFDAPTGRWYDCRTVTLPWTDGRSARLSLTVDVTGRKRLEDDLLRLNGELERVLAERTDHLRSEIGGRVLAERQLAESDQRFRAFIEHLPAAIFIRDTKGKFLSVNRTFRHWVNLAFSVNAEKASVYDAYPDDLAREAIAFDRQVVRTGRSIQYERALPTRQDGERQVLVIKFPLLDWDGSVAAIGGVLIDITQQRKTELDLRKVFRAVEQSGTVVMVTDTKGCIEFVNGAFERVTGYSAEEMVGRPPSSLQSGYTARAVYQTLWAAIRSGRIWEGELLDRRKNGTLFWFAVRIAPIRDRRGKIAGYVAVGDDVTEAKARDRALQAATEKAECASRAKSRFLATVSHELRTPLNAVIGFSDLLLSEMATPCATDAAPMEFVQEIKTAGNRLQEIVESILTFTRLESGHYPAVQEPFLLHTLIDQGLQRIAGTVSTDVVTIRQVPSTRALLMGDPKSVQQLLDHLLSNAAKFTETGEITVGVEQSPDGWLLLIVQDTGIGMTQAQIEAVKEPFEQVENPLTRSRAGTGIGLTLVRAITRLHDATLTIESGHGKGTRVTVAFPPERLLRSDADDTWTRRQAD